MSMTMISLGEFRFAIDTAAYERLALSQSWRWPEQQRLGRDPALQFVGADAAEIELEGVIYPQFRGGLGQVERLRQLADEGKPLMLVDGLGRVWGKWVILKVSDTRTVLMDDGQARRIDFRLTLKAYGEDVSGRPRFAVRVPSAPSAMRNDVSERSVAALIDAAEALPAITDAMSDEAIVAAGKQAFAMLEQIARTMGEKVLSAQTALDTIRDLSAGAHSAVTALRDEIMAFRVPDFVPPALANGWRAIVPLIAQGVAGRGELIAQAAHEAIDAMQSVIDDRMAGADDVVDAIETLARGMQTAAAAARTVERRWI